MCGRPNHYYDPNKPARLERANWCKIQEILRQERENFELSQSCISDGDFKDEEGNLNQDVCTNSVVENSTSSLDESLNSSVDESLNNSTDTRLNSPVE